MADNNFKDYLINFILAGLFLVSLITFGTTLASNYGNPESIIDTEYIALSELEQQINNSNTKVKSLSDAFKSDAPIFITGVLILTSLGGIFISIWDLVIGLLYFFLNSVSSILGIPPIVIGVVLTIALIALMFAVWKVWKTGE